MSYPVPDAALDDRLAWIGTSGSGKTYNASAAIERLLASGAKVVIIDPLGVWWGLRLNADGKRAAFDLPIFGGDHGDLPLNEGAGKLIGETAASMRESCIIDLSALATKEAERRFMLAFLEALYRHAAGDSMHAIFDEADLWAPQNPSKQGAGPQLQSLMEQIVRRGRVRGFIPWLITQRPAVISKDVLSQADGLVAFKLTSSQDRAAIGAWIKGQADEGQWPAIDRALPGMQRGEGVIWIPARGILESVKFPAKATFDSSRAPKRGEARERRALKPLDLEGLKEKLSSIEQEAKANDPQALKGRIATLERELAAEKKHTTVDLKVNAKPAIEEVSEIRGQLKALEARALAAESKLAKIGKILGGGSTIIAPDTLSFVRSDHAPRSIVRAKPSRIAGDFQPADGQIPSGCAKPLAALAGVYPAGMSEPQWALAAGYKRSGGTWGAYKSRLQSAGLIEKRDGRFFASAAGAAAIGPVETPPAPGPDLVRWWAARLSGTRPIAEALIDAWPQGLSKEDLADRVGMTASGGSFGAYLSRLASSGLITRGAEIRLAEEVMGG